jgi:hypothetical protein
MIRRRLTSSSSQRAAKDCPLKRVRSAQPLLFNMPYLDTVTEVAKVLCGRVSNITPAVGQSVSDAKQKSSIRSGTARPAAIVSRLGGLAIGITPLTARSLVPTLTFPPSQTYLDTGGQALKEIREAQQHALGPRVQGLLCPGACLLSVIAPMFRSELAHSAACRPVSYNLTRISTKRLSARGCAERR